MASFDFIDAAAKGYEFSWCERSKIVRNALPVIFVKIICIVFIYVLGIQNQHSLSGLVEMPGYILEGILVVSIVRYIAYSEPMFSIGRGDPSLSDSQKPAIIYVGSMSKANAFKAGLAIFLLIKIVQLAFVGVLLDYSQTIDPKAVSNASDPTMASAIIMLALMGIFFWAFRLVWIYIPAAMGYSVKAFLQTVKGMRISFGIFATWFVCYLPLVVLFAGASTIIDFTLVDDSFMKSFAYDMVRILAELVLTVVQMVAMTYGFIQILLNRRAK